MKNEQDFIIAVKDQLHQRETDLPNEVSARLRAARQAAVAEVDASAQKRVGWLQPGWMLPASGVAVAILALVLFLPSANGKLPVLEESEMLAATEMEMLNDIELLAWIIEEDGNAEL